MPSYRSSFLDRLGPDGPAVVRSAVMAITFSPLGAVIGVMAGIRMGAAGRTLFLFALAGVMAAAIIIYLLMRAIPSFGGAVMQSVLLPSGDTTAYETDFSYEDALVMRGDVRGALESLEQRISAGPLDAPARLKAAEICASAGKYDRARELYREVQRIPGVSSRDDLIASYRLIDLYREKLREPGRSLPEFRRLIDRYPNSPTEQNARAALAKLKESTPPGESAG